MGGRVKRNTYNMMPLYLALCGNKNRTQVRRSECAAAMRRLNDALKGSGAVTCEGAKTKDSDELAIAIETMISLVSVGVCGELGCVEVESVIG
jgi:hypothetical protein